MAPSGAFPHTVTCVSHEIPPFRQRLREALASESLPVALGRALSLLSERRAEAFDGRDFTALRDSLAARRQAAVDSLPELVDQFTEAATAAGAVVYPPVDAATAVMTVLGILERHRVRTVVKSKSMAAEEIGLNAALEHAGIEVVETDLGEFLVQAARERPSHIVLPALHLTRERAAELINRVTGENLPPDPDRLVAAARRYLREKLIQAGAGITGANALVAETGSLVLVSNEGNARLTSGLPPVHVAIAGIDKLVPTLADATAILELLPRSATGQPLTSYVSFVTGPSRSADIEMSLSLGVHGPREVHVVLLDSGRSEMRQDPEFRAALQCIRCGACSNICPSYQQVGGHAMGHVYAGPIGLVLTPFLHSLDDVAGPQTLCAGCNACATVCPAGVPLPDLILSVRERAVEAGPAKHRIKSLALRALASQRLFDWGPRVVARLPGVQSLARLLPGSPLRARPLPNVLAHPFRDRIAGLAARSPAATVRVACFPGCLSDWMAPEIGEAAVELLQRAGVEVVPVAFPSCCGLPAINSGYRKPAIRMAKQTIEACEQADADWIVSTSTSCVGAVVHDYARLFADDPEWCARAERVAARMTDLASFLDRVGPPAFRPVAAPRTVTIHDSCQSKNTLRTEPQVRRLLAAAGYEVREAPDSGECCGFGGSFSFDHPEVARRMRRRKLNAFAATGASVICGDNPGCLAHLQAGERIDGAPPIRHLAELLRDALASTLSCPGVWAR